jgi:hypothetical protein
MGDGINFKRIGKKLGLILSAMVLFILVSMWFKGLIISFRVFMALFASLSAWMGIISLVIWLWKETNKEDSSAEENS